MKTSKVVVSSECLLDSSVGLVHYLVTLRHIDTEQKVLRANRQSELQIELKQPSSSVPSVYTATLLFWRNPL